MRISQEDFDKLPTAMTRRAKAGRGAAEPEHMRIAGAAPATKAKQPGGGGMQAMQALGRLPAGKMNKTEEAYAAHLELRKQAGEVLWYKFEGIKLRLADKTFYTVDFFVMPVSRELEAHEVKGFWTDDARVKIKVAAELYPVFKFIAVKASKSKETGAAWEVESF